jgi:2-keto-4-pentenoate hydratase
MCRPAIARAFLANRRASEGSGILAARAVVPGCGRKFAAADADVAQAAFVKLTDAGGLGLSEAFELKAGDSIYSGTPENVGPVVKSDVLLCKLEGLPDMSIRIT